MEEESSISLILLDVLRGYSVLRKGAQKFFFKHFTYLENLSLNEYEEEQLEIAARKGIKTEKELIEEAISKKYWSLKSEEKIKSLKWTISKAEIAIGKMTDRNQQKIFKKSIKKQEDELSELSKKREYIVLYSAENFASGKKNNKLIQDSIFCDESLTKHADEEEAFELLDKLKHKLTLLSKNENLIQAAYEGSFFDLYSLNEKNPLSLINRDVFTVTILQKSLLVYASLLLNRLKNLDIPEDIRKDPMKILQFKESDTQTEKKTEGVDDLKQKMSKRGGRLKAEDLLS